MGWVEIIHNCPVPQEAAIREQEAQVGSLWECNSTIPGSERKCNDRWKLRQIKPPVQVVARGNGKYPDWQRLTVNGEPVPKED